MAERRRSTQTAAKETARRLAASGVEAVALAIVINSGVTLVKTIPLRRFEDAVKFGIGLSPVFTVFQVDDQITSSPHIGGPTGDTRLMPEPAQTVALAASPGWAIAPVDQLDQEGEPYPGCPRTFARRMLERLAGHGLELRGGYEIEFFLGHRGLRGAGHRRDAVPSGVLDRAARAVGAALRRDRRGGHAPRRPPHDQGRGPEPRVRRVVRTGRLRRTGRQREPLASEPVGSEREESVPGRTRPRGHDAPGRGVHGGGSRGTAVAHCDHRAFGPELRTTPTPPVERPVGLLGSGEPRGGTPLRNGDARQPTRRGEPHGLDRELSLPEPVADDPASIPARRRRSMGIRQLPGSLGVAIRELEKSSMIREAMGDVLFDSFLATRRAERDVFEGQDPEDVVRAHRWRY